MNSAPRLLTLKRLANVNEHGVENRAAAEVVEALRGEEIDVVAAGGELIPVEAGGDDAGTNAAVDVGAQGEAAAVVEDVDGVAVGDAAGGRVVGVHFEDAVEGGFHLPVTGQIGEGRVHIVVGLARQELEGITFAGGRVARFRRGTECGQRIDALRGEGCGVELDSAAGSFEGAFGEGKEVLLVRVFFEAQALGATGGVEGLRE